MSDTKTDIKQSEEWQKATAYEISEDDIERQRKLIGVWEPMKQGEYVQTATVGGNYSCEKITRTIVIQ